MASPFAGPRYTPKELQALIAYSNASFAEKQALLAGGSVSEVSAGGGFHWSDAGVGAGVALGGALLAGGIPALLARLRNERRSLRHT
jgi:hypothetical protein